MNPREHNNIPKNLFLLAILGMVLMVSVTIWSYNQTPQWEKLPPPPAPIVELLPPWDYVRIQTTDNVIYSKDVWGRRVEESWFIDANSIPDQVDSYSPICTFAEIPNSIRGTRPQSLQACRKFYIHVEALPSYIVLDDEQQLWVWTDQALPVASILFGGGVLIIIFTLFPFLFIMVKSFNRRYPEVPVPPQIPNRTKN